PHRFEGRAGAIRLDLVVARGAPDCATVFQPYLPRTEHVAGRAGAECHTVTVAGFAPGQRPQRQLGGDTRTQDAFALGGGEVMPHAPARMLAVGVGDDGTFHRSPGIDVEITGRAIEAFRAGDDEIHGYRRSEGLQLWNLSGSRVFGCRVYLSAVNP